MVQTQMIQMEMSQWNPRRSRGASQADRIKQRAVSSQWNPRRSRGASRQFAIKAANNAGLSGTPAEAGVRAIWPRCGSSGSIVSVEPPPKQGCEVIASSVSEKSTSSQWNPRRSRGARCHSLRRRNPATGLSGTPAEAGVRGIRQEIQRPRRGVSVEPPPKQGCEL